MVSNKEKALPFEEALDKLESIVDQMEEGELSLDDMIKCFEEGNKLSKYCSSKLKSFEKKIEILTREDSEGGEWTEFDAASGRREAEISTATDEDTPQDEDCLF